jgi:hypothetical protein
MYYLLQQVGQRLTECHIIQRESTSELVSNSIWRYLPEVKILGVSFEQLVILSPPTDFVAGQINILVHLKNSITIILPEDCVIAVFKQNWTTSIVRQLTIDASWAELIQSVNMRQEWSKMGVIGILIGLAGSLRDCDGVLFEGCIRNQLCARKGEPSEDT